MDGECIVLLYIHVVLRPLIRCNWQIYIGWKIWCFFKGRGGGGGVGVVGCAILEFSLICQWICCIQHITLENHKGGCHGYIQDCS